MTYEQLTWNEDDCTCRIPDPHRMRTADSWNEVLYIQMYGCDGQHYRGDYSEWCHHAQLPSLSIPGVVSVYLHVYIYPQRVLSTLHVM